MAELSLRKGSRVIAPKKAHIVQQQTLKKVSVGARGERDGAWRLARGWGWRTLSAVSLFSSFAQWVRTHFLPINGPLKVRNGAHKVFDPGELLSLLLSSLTDLEKESSLGKESQTAALQEGSTGCKAPLPRQLLFIRPEPLTCEMVLLIALFS